MSQGFLKFTPTPLFIEILFQNNINIGNRKQMYWKQQQQQQQHKVGEWNKPLNNNWILPFEKRCPCSTLHYYFTSDPEVK